MKTKTGIFTSSCLGIGFSFLLSAQSAPSPALLALSKTDQTLAIIDPATLKVGARLPSGPDPHEVIASTDGKLAFISNYGQGKYNTISVIDLVNGKALPAIDLGALRAPHGLRFVGGKLWFTAETEKVIGSYDPTTKKVDWILGTGQNRTHMIYVLDDLKTMVTSNVNSATLSIIEKNESEAVGGAPKEEWLETVVPVGKGAEGFDLSPDDKEIWAANAQDGTISVVNLAQKKVIATLGANVKGANRLKFTPDGKLILVASTSLPAVAVFDAATRKEVKRIPVGHGASGILMQPDGARAFIACSPDDYLAVVDLKTLSVAGRISSGKNPDGLAWAARR